MAVGLILVAVIAEYIGPGGTGTFECRAEDDCPDYECGEYVLIAQIVFDYESWDCSECYCDEPDKPIGGELYIL
jgi:hypothetical protein